MMGIKWVGGVCLAYMALAYIRDALPKETAPQAGAPGHGLCRIAAWSSSPRASVLAGIHVAAERRKSPIARLSKPTKLASIVPAIAGLFMVLTWYQLSQRERVDSRRPSAEVGVERGGAVAKANDGAQAAARRLRRELVRGVQRARREDVPRSPGARRGVAVRRAPRGRDAMTTIPAVAKVRRSTTRPRACPSSCSSTADGQEAMRFTEFVPPDRFAARPGEGSVKPRGSSLAAGDRRRDDWKPCRPTRGTRRRPAPTRRRAA